MADKRSLSSRLDDIVARLEELEERHAHERDDSSDGYADLDSDMRYCAVPPDPQREFDSGISDDRRRAILAIGNKWANRTHLHYYMFDSGLFGGANSQQDVVREAFDVWKDVGIGLVFSEVSSSADAEIRVGFLWDGRSWSTVGTGALTRGLQERTMNLGWRIDVAGPNGLDTAIHEVGHALGFHHEHQNPNAGIVWNREAVYDHFARTQQPPWPRETTDFNVLDTIPSHTVEGSNWDPNSIMHYSFAPGLIRQPVRFRNGLTPQPGLSQEDIEVVRRFYPNGGTGGIVPELRPWESQRLSLSPGEQKDFNVLPTETRDYDFRTFGQSDTVMVLFEEDNGDFRYVEGDDDSGFNRNASFRVRLIKGKTYQLRIRLYYQTSSGDTVVMMW